MTAFMALLRSIRCLMLLLSGLAMFGCRTLDGSHDRSETLGHFNWKFDYQRQEVWYEHGQNRFKGVFWVDPHMPARNIEFDFDYDIYQTWRFNIISRTGNHYVIQSTHPYTDSFVFLAKGGDGGHHGPRNVRISQKFDYQRNEVWPVEGCEKRFKGTIWLDRELPKDMKIAFDYNYEIFEYWRFKILEHTGNHYVIQVTDTGTDSLVFMAQGWDDGWNAPYNVQFDASFNGQGKDPTNGPSPTSSEPDPAQKSGGSAGQVATTDQTDQATKIGEDVGAVQEDQVRWGSPVSYNGRLKVVGTQLLNQNGKPIQLRGVSTHGLQWNSHFIHTASILGIKHVMNASLIRAAMYTDEGGYLSNPGIKDKVHEIVRLAIANGMYVIIDWHNLRDRNPMWNVEAAKRFLDEMARTYAGYPNVIYEICNEPNGDDVTWNESVRPYAEQVIATIRRHDPNNIIITGTPRWSSDIAAAAANPLRGELAHNVMYSFHYYAGSHGDVRSTIESALGRGLPIFVSEWGVSTADGRNGVFVEESRRFLTLLREKSISWAAWSLAADGNASSLLRQGVDPWSFWHSGGLSEAGRLVQEFLGM